jgi:hypothetical protein
MARAQDISRVADNMPRVSRWEIERQIDKGDIDPANYTANDPDKEL